MARTKASVPSNFHILNVSKPRPKTRRTVYIANRAWVGNWKGGKSRCNLISESTRRVVVQTSDGFKYNVDKKYIYKK